MQPIIAGLLVVLDHREAPDEKNGENIEKVNESFILMNVTLGLLRN